eukprot:m.186940 g.186940  ORF g.186940 m.186940 type:complete len:658 (-) comp15066_c0_seq7:298-2271(-)
MSMNHRPSTEQLRQLDNDCRKAASEACRLDKEGRYEDAMTMYAMAKCFLEDAIRFSDNYDRQRRYAEAAESYGNRGRAIEVMLRQRGGGGGAQPAAAQAAPASRPPTKHRADVNASRQDEPDRTISSQPPPYTSATEAEQRGMEVSQRPQCGVPTPKTEPSRAMQPQRRQSQPPPSHLPSEPQHQSPQRPNQPREIDPHFLSLAPRNAPSARTQLRIEAGSETFTGEVTIPTAALQKFLVRRAEAVVSQPDTKVGQSGPANPRKGPTPNSGADGGDGHAGNRTLDHEGPSPKPLSTASSSGETVEPAVEPTVNPDGSISGARTAFGQEAPRGFDSGVAYRGKNWNDLVRQSQNPVGPPQVPLQEQVSLAERSEQQLRQAAPANARINAKTSDGRAYSIDGGLETKAYIDPNRSLGEVLTQTKEPRPANPDLRAVVASPDVLFETTAMGAKLRNQHRIGGERVKEMDHFVASVETPTVRVTQKDVAPLVAEMEMKGAEPVMIMTLSDTEHYAGEVGDVELKIQSRYRNADGSVNEPVLRHAAQFNGFILTVCREIIGYTGPIQLYYMTTIRANSAVCCVSKEDGKLYFNVLSFQQSQPLHPETGQLIHTRRLWTYWVQRTAIALSAGSEEWSSRPTGLYDPDIRARFRKQLTTLNLNK